MKLVVVRKKKQLVNFNLFVFFCFKISLPLICRSTRTTRSKKFRAQKLTRRRNLSLQSRSQVSTTKKKIADESRRKKYHHRQKHEKIETCQKKSLKMPKLSIRLSPVSSFLKKRLFVRIVKKKRELVPNKFGSSGKPHLVDKH